MLPKLNPHLEQWASDKHVKQYDKLSIFFPYILSTKKITGEIVELVREIERNDELHILDVATGTGNIALAINKALSKETTPFSITAFDSDERMLSRARNKLERSGAGNRVSFRNGDLLSADFCLEPGLRKSFDVIVISNALFLFNEKNKKAILKKAYNLLGNNGMLIISEPREAAASGPLKLLLQHIIHKSIIQLLLRLPAIIAISKENKRMQTESFMISAEAQAKLLHKSGFFVEKTGATYGNRNVFFVCSKMNHELPIQDVSDKYFILTRMIFANLIRLGLISLAVELIGLLSK